MWEDARGRSHCRRTPTRQSRPRHARAPAQEPHLLSAQVLRLPHQPLAQHHREPRPRTHGPHRHKLHRIAPAAPSGRKESRRLPHQPLWSRALPHLLQELHGKSLGHALRQDLRRVGSAAHQGPLAHHRAQTLSAQGLYTHTKSTAGDLPKNPPTPHSSSASSIPSSAPASSGSTSQKKVTALGGEIHLGAKVDRSKPTASTSSRSTTISDTAYAPASRATTSLHHAHARPHPRPRRGGAAVPANVTEVAEGLQYRDFITIGILANKLDVTESDKTLSKTPGSTSRSPTSSSAGCRSSTTGRRTWSPTPPRSGSASNTSAMTLIRSGHAGRRTREIRAAEWSRSAS